jgi:hypothetical protein
LLLWPDIDFDLFLDGDLVGERLDLERLVLSPSRLTIIFLTFLRIELGLVLFFRDLAVLSAVDRVDLVLRLVSDPWHIFWLKNL